MPNICFSAGCKTGYKRKKGERVPSLFRAPKDPACFQLWKKSIPRADKELTPNSYVCEKHFREEDVVRYYETKLFDGNIYRMERDRPKLTPGSVPCIFREVPGHSTYEDKDINEKSNKKSRKKLTSPKNKTCKKQTGDIKISSSEKKPKQKKASLVQLEKENILFEGIIFHPIVQNPPSPQALSPNESDGKGNEMDCAPTSPQNSLVNSSDSSILNNSLPTGVQTAAFEKIDEVNTMDCAPTNPQSCLVNSSESSILNSSLPSGAQTAAFKEIDEANTMDSSPTHLEDFSIEESESIDSVSKELIHFPFHPHTEEYSVPHICEHFLNESNVVLPKSVVREQFSFNFFKTNINNVELLNSWWKINMLDDFISFIRWTPDHTIERKIVITKDFDVKVFLKDKKTNIGKDLEVVSIDAISKLIFNVERIRICNNINGRNENCNLFLQSHYLCKKHELCLNCLKWEKELQKPPKIPKKMPSNIVELIRFNLND